MHTHTGLQQTPTHKLAVTYTMDPPAALTLMSKMGRGLQSLAP